MSTGNGQTTIYNASQSLCTTAKPIRPDSTTMWTNMQSHPIVAFNGGVMTVRFVNWLFVVYFQRLLDIHFNNFHFIFRNSSSRQL